MKKYKIIYLKNNGKFQTYVHAHSIKDAINIFDELSVSGDIIQVNIEATADRDVFCKIFSILKIK